MERFLKLKHWQLFGLMFFVPLVVQIGFVLTVVRNFMALSVSGQELDPANMFKGLIYYLILILYLLFLHFGWYWVVGIKLQEKIPVEIRLKTGMCKFFIIFPLVYIIAFSFAMYWFIPILGGLQFQIGQSIGPWIGFIPFLLFPLQLFCIFCAFYCMYFTARTIKTAELQRAARLDDYIGEFFLIWFFPIGVWILQPRLNRLVAEDENSIYKPGSDYMMK